jgi:outer membrane protein TolC
MSLSWIVLTLALIAADDPQPSPPALPSSALTVHIRFSNTPTRTRPSACMVETIGSRGACELLETIRDNLYPEGLVDEMTIAACRYRVGEDSGFEPGSTGKPAASSDASPKPSEKGAPPRTMDDPEAQETWPMTLRDAIGIALDNSEIVRIVALGARGVGGAASTGTENAKREYSEGKPIGIARVNADASSGRFRAEVMALVRSVEQQYWNLAQAHVQLWAADRAASMAKEVLDREQAELLVSRGTVADVAEAAQRLEQLNLDLVTRTSDVITSERQLRNLLGLPPADNRRIIPATPPTEARLEPDWDSSLTEMLAHQPDVVEQRTLVRLAELGLLIARNQLLPVLGPATLHDLRALGSKFEFDRPEIITAAMVCKSLLGMGTDQEKETATAAAGGSPEGFTSWQTGYTFPSSFSTRGYPLANSRTAQYVLLRSRAYHQQVVHQATHSLARSFLEVDANYKQFRTASRLRQAAAQRLDAQRAYYEEGRITVDRYFDAISQYATAVATEAQYKTTYNSSIVTLEEAKGTLLAYDNIAVAGVRRPSRRAPMQLAGADVAHRQPIKPDHQVRTASFIAESTDAKASTAKAAGSGDAKAATPPKTNTWTFSFSIGQTNPLQIKGTVTSSEGTPAPDNH